jgi:hypothetical protein
MPTLFSVCELPPTSFFARDLEALSRLSFFRKGHPRQPPIQPSRLLPKRPYRTYRSAHKQGQGLTSSDRSAWASKVEFRAPSCGMTRAGWPMRVTTSFPPWEGVGNANKRSRILSIDKFDAPQTSKRIGLGLTGVIEVSCRMISMRVCVFPVPVQK